MSAVAHIAQQQGITVSGSDGPLYPPVSNLLTEYGIEPMVGYAAENISATVDCFVIGKSANLLPEVNEEVRTALASGIRVASYPELLNELLGERQRFVITGSFGKSSITALATHILQQAGKDPSYLVGAQALNLSSGGHFGTGNIAVVEGDEYPSAHFDNCPKFLHYHPTAVLLTSGEHDHVNVYPTLTDYHRPFITLLESLPESALVIACAEGAHVTELVQHTKAQVIWYAGHSSGWGISDVLQGEITTANLTKDGVVVAEVSTTQLGLHVLQNIAGVAALLLTTESVTLDEFCKGVASFMGVRRRLERKTDLGKPAVYEDFGSSHPKLRAGVRTMREYFPNKRLLVVFEPYTFSLRNQTMLHWYDTLFAGCDEVIILDPPNHGAQTHQQVSGGVIAERVMSTGIPVRLVTTGEELLQQLPQELSATNDILLIETAGNLQGAIPEIVRRFNS